MTTAFVQNNTDEGKASEKDNKTDEGETSEIDGECARTWWYIGGP